MSRDAGLPADDVRRAIEAALAEDLGTAGDITSQAVVATGARFRGVLVAREELVVAGLQVAAQVFATVEPAASWDPKVCDGVALRAGEPLAEVEGPARGLLTAERTALNFLQHLSGIATLTRRYVNAMEGTGAVLLDTRKTIPGLRSLAKYATRIGGAANHRMGLHDGVLIKDNHIAVSGSLAEAVRLARSKCAEPVEVECDTLAQVREALAAGADMILLDNMTPPVLHEAVLLVGGRAKTEASGGVTLGTVRAIAESGVDYVSVGAITQSARAVDIGLDWQVDVRQA